MNRSRSHILGLFATEVWGLRPERLTAIINILQLDGRASDFNAVTRSNAPKLEAASWPQGVSASSGGGVAVLPLQGIIVPRGSIWDEIFGSSGTSIERFMQMFRQALNGPGDPTIVIDIDSPGGCVSGVSELASEILAARKAGKKIIAISRYQCASSAYWIASACTEIVVSPSSLTGGIGVYTAHNDISKMLEQAGISTTLIYYGENKVQGSNLAPLNADDRAEFQDLVNYSGTNFTKAVAQGRRMKASDVTAKLGQGKVFNAQKAVSSGMADSIGTLDGVLARFGVSRTPSASSQAHSSVVQPMAAASGIHASEDGCACDCDPCIGGDCGECETTGCDFAGCNCSAAVGKRDNEAKALQAQIAHAHRERELQLAQAF